MNNLTFHLMAIGEEEEQTKSKVSSRKEIIKTRAEINRKVIEKLLKTKSWFLEKIFFNDKSLPNLTKVKKRRESVCKAHI